MDLGGADQRVDVPRKGPHQHVDVHVGRVRGAEHGDSADAVEGPRPGGGDGGEKHHRRARRFRAKLIREEEEEEEDGWGLTGKCVRLAAEGDRGV